MNNYTTKLFLKLFYVCVNAMTSSLKFTSRNSCNNIISSVRYLENQSCATANEAAHSAL